MTTHTLKAPTTVFASTTTGLAQFIERMGGDSASILVEAGFVADRIAGPNNVIYLHQYCRALACAADYTGRQNFGLWFGQQYLPRQLGMFGYLGSSSPTLGEALANMHDHMRFHQTNSRLGLESRNGRTIVSYFVDEQLPDGRHDTELSLGQLLNQLREPLGRAWSPLQVRFTHGKPTGWSEHRDVFGSEVLFNQDCNGIVLLTSDLETPMPYQDPMLLNVMKQSLQRFGEHQIPVELSIAARTRDAIRSLLRHGYPHLDEVAKRVGLAPWTLQRRLAEESRNFKDLVEEVRIHDAPLLLAKQHLSISKTSELLGYSEISAFSRAFHRWYQVAPRQWRLNAEASKGQVPHEPS